MVPNPINSKPRIARRPRRRNVNSLIAQKVNEHMYGKVIKPSASPPVFSLQPWNDMIVCDKIRVDKSEITYSIDKLASNLIKQAGLYTQSGQIYTGCSVEFQIVNFNIWNISNESGGILRVHPTDFLSSIDQTHELTNIGSRATKNQYAALSYEFPSSHQQHVHYKGQKALQNKVDDDQLGNLSIIDVNGHSDVEIHVKVSWRCA